MEDFAHLWKTKDLFAAIENLELAENPIKAAKDHADLAGALYWKEKRLAAFVLVASTGITYALREASRASDETMANELLGIAKGIAYNLGSFTWPGWDEPGIEIGATDLAIGREAAKLNLRLAQELRRGDLPLSRAYWLIGAHELAAGDWESSRLAFTQAENHARAAGQAAGTLLNTAYQRLAESLAAPTDEAKKAAVIQADQALAGVEGGKELQGQVLTALRVFLTK